jgi:hypothetical protein
MRIENLPITFAGITVFEPGPLNAPSTPEYQAFVKEIHLQPYRESTVTDNANAPSTRHSSSSL